MGLCRIFYILVYLNHDSFITYDCEYTVTVIIFVIMNIIVIIVVVIIIIIIIIIIVIIIIYNWPLGCWAST
jgi:hypothetical protein